MFEECAGSQAYALGYTRIEAPEMSCTGETESILKVKGGIGWNWSFKRIISIVVAVGRKIISGTCGYGQIVIQTAHLQGIAATRLEDRQQQYCQCKFYERC